MLKTAKAMSVSPRKSRMYLLLLPALSLALAACGLNSKSKDSCSRQSDCLDGFVCNSDTLSCDAELPDGGPVLDADVQRDSCVPVFTECTSEQCGSVPNGCGERVWCGGCDAPETCEGSGIDYTCGCTPESDAELCAAAGLAECGSLDVLDSCGGARSLSCGSCSGNDECGGWAVGYCAEVVCSGDNWCRALSAPLLVDLHVQSIWGDGAGNTYVAASNGTPTGRVLHHDGSSLSLLAEGAQNLTGVSGAGSELFCSSYNGDLLSPSSGALGVLEATSRGWTDLVAISPTDVWAVGSFGNLPRAMATHFDGNAWTESSFGGIYALNWRFMSVSASAWNSVWAVGFDGNNGSVTDGSGPLVASYDGAQWTMHTDLPTSQYLYSVWVAAANDIWVVGKSGTIVHFDGVSWTLSDSGVSLNLYAVTKAGNDVWAGGQNGILLKKVGPSWVPQQTGTTRHIHALWANSTGDIWAGGADGLLLHHVP